MQNLVLQTFMLYLLLELRNLSVSAKKFSYMQINIGLKYPLNKVSYLLYLIKMKKWFTVLTLFCISLRTYRMVFDHLSVLSLSVDRKNDRKSHFSYEKLTQCANTFLIHCTLDLCNATILISTFRSVRIFAHGIRNGSRQK